MSRLVPFTREVFLGLFEQYNAAVWPGQFAAYAVGILILLLCGADALLTLTLISRGAVEVNPVMDPLVRGSGQSFALWKFVLTSMGVVILTLLARLRMFGRAVGTILYVFLAMYVVLVGYEIFLLRNIPLD